MSTYFQLMDAYLGEGEAASRLGTCLAVAKRTMWRSCPPLVRFTAIGVEGSGHHVLERMDTSLCGGGNPAFHTCGGQYSFPSGLPWRQNADQAPLMPNCTNSFVRPYSKHVVLLRDPIDTAASALRRFWEYSSNDTFSREMEVHKAAWCAMSSCVEQLPCETMLILSYELLVAFPSAHIGPLA
eukprot:1070650-Prymnesium_polylepis.1